VRGAAAFLAIRAHLSAFHQYNVAFGIVLDFASASPKPSVQ